MFPCHKIAHPFGVKSSNMDEIECHPPEMRSGFDLSEKPDLILYWAIKGLRLLLRILIAVDLVRVYYHEAHDAIKSASCFSLLKTPIS